MSTTRLPLLFVIWLALLLGGCASSPPLPQTTETLTWTFVSEHPNIVQLEFYSQHRNAAWPGGGNAYEIADYKPHTYTLTCRTTEKICYGAWVKGDADTYWGVGADDAHGCTGCCRTCATGDAGTVRLLP